MLQNSQSFKGLQWEMQRFSPALVLVDPVQAKAMLVAYLQ